MKALVSLLVLGMFAAAAEAKVIRGNAACANGSCAVASVPVAIQMPPVIVQTRPIAEYSSGCQGGSGASVAAGSCTGNQGSGCAGSSGQSSRRLSRKLKRWTSPKAPTEQF